MLTPDLLEREYTIEGRSAAAIAAEVGCNHQTVLSALRRHGIPTRSGGLVTYGEILTREFLEEKYLAQGRAASDLAAEVGCNASTVFAALSRHGIRTRNAADAD